jgi:ppGpp synthetase/RelA/SpoT-type nucleotidyltranferase
MMPTQISARLRQQVNRLVQHYIENLDTFERFARNLQNLVTDHPLLKRHVHSIRARVKDPGHLRDKLQRKRLTVTKAGRRVTITKSNLFELINDLTGIRIIHLHTRQIQEIDVALKQILADERIKIIEGPIARTWDDESRAYFAEIGIETVSTADTLYTSVHYIVESNDKTAEIQVRTLAEEIWGEVDHTINYPHPTTAQTCAEQIKVLARATSTCSRLVDSIFRSHSEHISQQARQTRRRRTARGTGAHVGRSSARKRKP